MAVLAMIVPVTWHVAALPQFAATASVPAPPSVRHLATPDSLYAIYMSQCAAGTPSLRDALVKFIEGTKLNVVVIDIKDYSGYLSFATDDLALAGAVSKTCAAKDMKDFIASLHEKGIYVIGRITVFQDPRYAAEFPAQAVHTKEGSVWKNYGGLAFVDVSSKPFWDYIVALSKAAYREEGFDELNYDYVRYPSDGPLSDAVFQDDDKPATVERFFQYLSRDLKPLGVPLSADLFGLASSNRDDLGIGQVLERAMPYFDYVDPMVYPSHYAAGFNGYKNVNAHPYDIVLYEMREATARAEATTTTVAALAETPIMRSVIVPASGGNATTTKEVATGLYEKAAYPASKIRPWLQSFDYPVTYTPAMVAAQIQATNDVGLQSYLVWDAANTYTALRRVLAETAASATTTPQ